MSRVTRGGDAAVPGASMEQRLIDEYLRTRGQSRHTIPQLPANERDKLLRAACDYASLRLLNLRDRRT